MAQEEEGGERSARREGRGDNLVVCSVKYFDDSGHGGDMVVSGPALLQHLVTSFGHHTNYLAAEHSISSPALLQLTHHPAL